MADFSTRFNAAGIGKFSINDETALVRKGLEEARDKMDKIKKMHDELGSHLKDLHEGMKGDKSDNVPSDGTTQATNGDSPLGGKAR